jgi:hypothetical protein
MGASVSLSTSRVICMKRPWYVASGSVAVMVPSMEPSLLFQEMSTGSTARRS